MPLLSITTQRADSLAGWRLKWQTQSFWCLLALSECGSLRSWRALVCWVEVRCLGHDSRMKRELSSGTERREHGRMLGRSLSWGQTVDLQLGCYFAVLVEAAKGRCSTARKDSNVVPSRTWDVGWWRAGEHPESLACITSSATCQRQQEVRQVYWAPFLHSSERRNAVF